MKTRTLYISLTAIALLFTACEGENPLGNASGVQKELADKYLNTEASISNIYNIMDKALRDNDFRNNDSATIDGAVVLRNGNTITIDYGNGAIGADGQTRKGSINISETGDYFNSGGSLDVSFLNYFVNDKKVEGDFNVYNNGSDTISMTITNFSPGGDFTLNATKTLAWQSGFSTLSDNTDDTYAISGMASGQDSSNNELTAEIKTPLVFDRGCQYGIVSGQVDLTLQADTATTSTDGSLDFLSNDGCDNLVKVTVTQNGLALTTTQQFSGF